MKTLRGCMTAIATPFNMRMEVDYQGLKDNIEFQLADGILGIVPLGTTGESPTVTDSERTMIIKTVVEQVNGRVPVIIGTGTNSTEHTIKYTKEASELGADAVLIVTPYYNKPSQEGIYRHFEAITKAVDIPIIVYNIASRTSVNIETSTMLRMSKLKNIIGVKEASGSISQIQDVINNSPDDFIVLSGDDNMTFQLISAGGDGVISVVSNLLPRRVSDMVNSALSGSIESARKMNDELTPIFKGAFLETNPVPIKTAMNMAGIPAGGVRLPLYRLAQANEDKLRSILNQYKELKLSRA